MITNLEEAITKKDFDDKNIPLKFKIISEIWKLQAEKNKKCDVYVYT